jgi:O-methyltransferase
MTLRQGIRKFAQKFGYDIVRYHPDSSSELPPDLSSEEKEIIRKVQPFTMTSVERLAALIDAIRHLSLNKVGGAIVECGVWRGGSAMAAALALTSMGVSDRDIFLYDTFEGMPPPTPDDVTFDGVPAAQQLANFQPGTGIWCYASIEDVKRNLQSTGYPPSKLHFVQGKVEDTIPGTLPGAIALLRLDTDWYESTKHELTHLFPLLNPKGVLIVDDYGHWAGARKAVDEYFASRREDFYIHRIDYTGRLILRINP